MPRRHQKTVEQLREEGIARACMMDEVGQVLGEDSLPLYYCSFLDPHGETDHGMARVPSTWLGGCYVPALDPVAATRAAHRLGCNPGGEVAIWGPFPRDQIKPECIGVLLNEEQLERAGDT